MKKMMLIISVLLLFMNACSEIDSSTDSLPEYTNLEKLDANYKLEDAITDNCVVFNDSALVFGQDIWNVFLATIEESKSCSVRIARYYSVEDALYLIDVSYDGVYKINTNVGDSRQYSYMKHYEFERDSGNEESSIIDCYLLINQENVSYEEIERSMASSIAGDAIDHYILYYDVS